MPRWVFIGAPACQLVNAGSTVFIQIPIQNQLSQTGFDRALLDRLIVTDLLLRKLPRVAEALLITFGLWKIVARATMGDAAETGRSTPVDSVR